MAETSWIVDQARVVDEEMLEQALVEERPRGQAGEIAEREGLQYEEVLHLSLEYKNILNIFHLWQFTSLTKLRLNNNVIEKIQGLENLTNLLWLDLSFNKIKVIEGMDTLVKLEDLSLFHNHISVVENLDALQNLNILSIGKNCIDRLDNVIYLRKFKNLRTLNLAGNPICDEKRYKSFVTAYLPQLVYLDYRLLDEETREEAITKYQYAIEEMQQNEQKEQQVMDAQKIRNQELQLHKDAFVEFLNGPQLFNSMFSDDPDADTLALLPEIQTLLESYKKKMEGLCIQIFDAGLSQHTQRTAEVECFSTCYREAVENNQQRAAQIAADFESSRRQKIVEMKEITDNELIKDHIRTCREELNQLSETLMRLELELVEQLEDIFKDFERNISEMVGGFIEFVQGIFAQCRDLENEHHEKQLEIALATLEKVAKNDLEEEMPDEVLMLFVDKDTVTSAVGASHDIHMLKIDNREEDLLTRVNSWRRDLLKTTHDEDLKRNRKRMSDINNYVCYVQNMLHFSQKQ